MPKRPTDDVPNVRHVPADAPAGPDDAPTRKRMVRPELTRHGSLPEVTGSFIGTFSP